MDNYEKDQNTELQFQTRFEMISVFFKNGKNNEHSLKTDSQSVVKI